MCHFFKRSEFQELLQGIVHGGDVKRTHFLPQVFPLTPRRDTQRVEGTRKQLLKVYSVPSTVKGAVYPRIVQADQVYNVYDTSSELCHVQAVCSQAC